MKLERIDTTAAFDDLASEWNDLLARSITDVPFLRHEYLRAWWSSLGGGEWPSAELSIVSGRDASNRLVGLAPLMCLRGGHDPSLHLLGSFEISDYLDLLVPAAQAVPFVRGLLDFLADEPIGNWQALDLYNLRAASPVRRLVLEYAEERGWPATEELLSRARRSRCRTTGKRTCSHWTRSSAMNSAARCAAPGRFHLPSRCAGSIDPRTSNLACKPSSS